MVPTDEEIYEAAKQVKKDSVKAYINSSDPAKALIAIQVLVSAMINNAGSLENLTLVEQALIARLGPVTP